MADGCREDAWDRTSAILSLTFNLNRGKNVQAKSPADFNPFAAKTKRKVESLLTMNIRDMKDIFMSMFGSARMTANPGLIGGGPVAANPDAWLPRLNIQS